MAKKAIKPSPSPEEFRGHLREAVRALREPSTTAALLKSMPAEFRLPEAAALPVLEQELQAGTVFSYPPKSAGGKPRYWDRDPALLVKSAVEAALSTPLEKPVTLKELLKGMKCPVKLTEQDVLPVLEDRISLGTLFLIPPASAKSGPRYWDRNLVDFGRENLLPLLRQKGPQQEASLKKALKGYQAAQAADVLSQMIADKQLWKHPAFGKIKKELWGLRPPSPTPYFRELGDQLAKVVRVLQTAEVCEQELRRSLVEMAESAGISFASQPDSSDDVPDQSAIDLVALLRRIEPGANRGALVGARDLRRAAGIEKQSFDREVLKLAREERFALHRHDYPASLSQSELDELVTDGEGTYYVGIALRGGSERPS